MAEHRAARHLQYQEEAFIMITMINTGCRFESCFVDCENTTGVAGNGKPDRKNSLALKEFYRARNRISTQSSFLMNL